MICFDLLHRISKEITVFSFLSHLDVGKETLEGEVMHDCLYLVSTSILGDTEKCIDISENCAQWVSRKECTTRPDYMAQNCKKSCEMCGPGKYEEANLIVNNRSILIKQTNF